MAICFTDAPHIENVVLLEENKKLEYKVALLSRSDDIFNKRYKIDILILERVEETGHQNVISYT